MNRIYLVFFVLVLIGLPVLLSTAYIVDEREKAIRLRFGKLEQTIDPGLHFKVPFMHRIIKLDSRLLTIDTPPQRYLTIEKKALLVDAYIKWKIDDIKLFYQKTSGDLAIAQRLIFSRADEGLRNSFGVRTLNEVVSGERDALMQELTESLDDITTGELGIRIIDVRIKRIDLPDEVSESVYARMASEREKEARELRSQGRELSVKIQAEADRKKDSHRIRGEEESRDNSR